MSARRGHGEGSIRRRADGRYEGRVDVGRDERGKRIRRSVFGRTKAEVVEKLDGVRGKVRRGVPLVDERQTVAVYLEWWAEHVAPTTVREATAEGYRGTIRRYVIPYIGRVKLAQLAPQHVQEMMTGLEAKGLAPATRKQARAVLRRALRHAERWDLVVRNAAALVDAPKGGQVRPARPLTAGEAKALLAAAADHRLEAVVYVMVTVGLRPGELRAVRWIDLDLDRGVLDVTGSLQPREGGGQVRDEPKTDASKAPVPLPTVTVAALRRHRVRQAEERLRAGEGWQDAGYVFVNEVGGPYDRHRLNRIYKEIAAAAGLGDRTIKDLRHSAATIALAAGVPLEQVSAMLRHSTLAITSDIYAKVQPEALRAATDRLGEILGG
jgi:integrase